MAAPCGFSIVVPTHGRTVLVRRLLEGLRRARDNYTGPTEVVVVDSSAEEDASAIREACTEHSAAYRRGPLGVHQKRNAGCREGVYPLVFFIDSDCDPDADVLCEHWAVYASGDGALAGVLGLTELTGPQPYVWRVLEAAGSFTAAFGFARWLKEVPWGTCTNLSIRRDILDAMGGFDETMPGRVYGEDVDLGLRIIDAGYRMRTNPKAIVRHSREEIRTYWQAARKAALTGRADAALGRRHPGRLALEFPSAPVVFAALALLAVLRWLWLHAPGALAIPVVWLGWAALGQAAWGARKTRAGAAGMLIQLGAIGLDWIFEVGRIGAALRHGEWSRLWTKLVYVREQLDAERDRRIIQMWSFMAAALLAALVQPWLESLHR